MAQADLNVANQSGSAFRADLNNQLLALGTLMSGASAPSTTYAYMLWADTTNGLLKQRNAANSDWITVRNLDGSYARGSAASPSIPFDGGTGIYSLGEDQVAIATGGTGRLFVDASGRILVGVSTALTNAYAISTALAPAVQLEGNTGNAAALSITRHASAAANLLLQRGVIGTPVVDTDAVGQINFNGFDGTNYFNAALIRGVVDGTPGANSMPGRLVFQTTPAGSTTPTEAMRINSQQQLLIGTATRAALGGVLQISNGITFPGTQSACSDANTLDDYEEGTWTPAYTSGANTWSYTTQVGKYTKVGNLIVYTFYINATCTAVNNLNAQVAINTPFAVGNTVDGRTYGSCKFGNNFETHIIRPLSGAITWLRSTSATDGNGYCNTTNWPAATAVEHYGEFVSVAN